MSKNISEIIANNSFSANIVKIGVYCDAQKYHSFRSKFNAKYICENCGSMICDLHRSPKECILCANEKISICEDCRTSFIHWGYVPIFVYFSNDLCNSSHIFICSHLERL